MAILNKAHLIEKLVETNGITKVEADKQISNVLEGILDLTKSFTAEGDKLQLTGFATFKRVHRKAREGRNPRDPKKVIQIEAKDAITCSLGKKFEI